MTKMAPEKMKEMWILQNKKVCLCKGIPRRRFEEAIKSGASSILKVNRIVGSGSGNCEGTRCGPVIEQLLQDYRDGVLI
jgi:bacterioferritin-associated ferredoxin